MAHIRKFFATVFAGAFATTAAFAQVSDDQIAGLVDDWLNTYAADFTPIVHEFGAQCITAAFADLPDAARQIVAAAGGIENGLTALENNDAATLDAFLPTLSQCVDTMYIGEQIVAWVDDYYVVANDEDKTDKTVCLLNAVYPLPTEAKQTIFAAPDFQAGIQEVMLNQPEAAINLDAVLKACV